MQKFPWCAFVTILSVGGLAFSAPAFAKIIPVKESMTPAQLGGACSSAGGSFNPAPDGKGASCTSKDGKTTVQCTNNGKCNASVPATKKGTTVGLGTALG